MAGVAASGNNGQIKLVSPIVGVEGNLVSIKAIIDPAGATGASTASVSGNDITLKLKNDGAGNITATNAEQVTALGASAAAARLGTASLVAGATGANTGAAWTGAAGIAVRLSGGTDGTAGYDDITGAKGDGWVISTITPVGAQATAYDQATAVLNGRTIRLAGASVTGATTILRICKNFMQAQARLGLPRQTRLAGATGAGEYVV